jgi:hypothetical protein
MLVLDHELAWFCRSVASKRRSPGEVDQRDHDVVPFVLDRRSCGGAWRRRARGDTAADQAAHDSTRTSQDSGAAVGTHEELGAAAARNG